MKRSLPPLQGFRHQTASWHVDGSELHRLQRPAHGLDVVDVPLAGTVFMEYCLFRKKGEDAADYTKRGDAVKGIIDRAVAEGGLLPPRIVDARKLPNNRHETAEYFRRKHPDLADKVAKREDLSTLCDITVNGVYATNARFFCEMYRLGMPTSWTYTFGGSIRVQRHHMTNITPEAS